MDKNDMSRPLAGLQTHNDTVECFIKMHSDAASKYNRAFFDVILRDWRCTMYTTNLAEARSSLCILSVCFSVCDLRLFVVMNQSLTERSYKIRRQYARVLAILFVFTLRSVHVETE